MIEIILLKKGDVIARAEAETPEDALFAARTLWDEEMNGLQLDTRNMAIYFMVDAQLVRAFEGRRP